MAHRIQAQSKVVFRERQPQVAFSQILEEGPSLTELSTIVAVRHLGQNPHHAQQEAICLQKAWGNLKSALVEFSPYVIMNRIEQKFGKIQLKHFQALADALHLQQLPMGPYSFASVAIGQALRIKKRCLIQVPRKFQIQPRVVFDQVLQEGPSLTELATMVVVKHLGQNPHHAQKEAICLQKLWENLKWTLLEFDTYEAMNQIEEKLASTEGKIGIKHFLELADKLQSQQLPVGVYSVACIFKERALREIFEDNIKPRIEQIRSGELVCFSSIERLHLFGCKLKVIPFEISALRKMKTLRFNGNEFNHIPDWLSTHFVHLEIFDLTQNLFSEIPKCMGNFKALRILNMSFNQISSIPDELCTLPQLASLDLSHNQLSHISDQIEKLSCLRELFLSENYLSTVPEKMGALSRLTSLDLAANEFSEIPGVLCQLKKLQRLNFTGNAICEIPVKLRELTALEEIGLDGTAIAKIPEWIFAEGVRVYL